MKRLFEKIIQDYQNWKLQKQSEKYEWRIQDTMAELGCTRKEAIHMLMMGGNCKIENGIITYAHICHRCIL